MDAIKGKTRSFPTSLGTALVWPADKSNPHGMAGLHFMLSDENGSRHYFSEHCRVFLRLSLNEPNWLPESQETDPEKVSVLRELWEKVVDRDFAQQNPF